MAMLGELPCRSGKIAVNGTMVYVSEQSWIFSDTVRENILFGMEMSQDWYNQVVHACALDKVSYTTTTAATTTTTRTAPKTLVIKHYASGGYTDSLSGNLHGDFMKPKAYVNQMVGCKFHWHDFLHLYHRRLHIPHGPYVIHKLYLTP